MYQHVYAAAVEMVTEHPRPSISAANRNAENATPSREKSMPEAEPTKHAKSDVRTPRNSAQSCRPLNVVESGLEVSLGCHFQNPFIEFCFSQQLLEPMLFNRKFA